MTDTEAVLRLFDELAGEYDQHIPFFAPFGRDLVAWCDLRPGQRVLDIAAGRGAVAGPAAQAVGPRGAVLAIDGSPNMLRALARDFGDVPQIETREMDAHHLAFPDASFDAVTCGLAFHIIGGPPGRSLPRPTGCSALAGSCWRSPRRDRGSRIAAGTSTNWYGTLTSEPARRENDAPVSETAPEPFTPPPRALPEICAAVGFTDVEQRTVQRSFDFRDPQHYWDFVMSHGFRGHVYSLGPATGRRVPAPGCSRPWSNCRPTAAASPPASAPSSPAPASPASAKRSPRTASPAARGSNAPDDHPRDPGLVGIPWRLDSVLAVGFPY